MNKIFKYFRRHENKWKLEVLIAAGVVVLILVSLYLAGSSRKMEENESKALARMLFIAGAQESYFKAHNRYGTLKEITDEETASFFADTELGEFYTTEPVTGGYRFTVTAAEKTWSCSAVPVEPSSSGRISFYADQTDEIRQAPCESASDAPAGPQSQAIRFGGG